MTEDTGHSVTVPRRNKNLGGGGGRPGCRWSTGKASRVEPEIQEVQVQVHFICIAHLQQPPG